MTYAIDYSPLEYDYSRATRRAGQQISIGIGLIVIDFIISSGLLLAIGVALTGLGVFFLTVSVKEHKLKAFAKANDGTYLASQSIVGRRASLFINNSDNARIRRLVSLPSGLELGVVAITDSQRHSLYYSFAKFPLTKLTPHFLIKKRWSLTSPMHDFVSSGYDDIRPKNNWQPVSTTHQFTEFFTVYTADNDVRTVHGILAPDVMAKIIDHAKTYDLEIIGDDCYILAEGLVDFSNADKMRHIIAVVEAIEPDLNQEITKVIR